MNTQATTDEHEYLTVDRFGETLWVSTCPEHDAHTVCDGCNEIPLSDEVMPAEPIRVVPAGRVARVACDEHRQSWRNDVPTFAVRNGRGACGYDRGIGGCTYCGRNDAWRAAYAAFKAGAH